MRRKETWQHLPFAMVGDLYVNEEVQGCLKRENENGKRRDRF